MSNLPLHEQYPLGTSNPFGMSWGELAAPSASAEPDEVQTVELARRDGTTTVVSICSEDDAEQLLAGISSRTTDFLNKEAEGQAPGYHVEIPYSEHCMAKGDLFRPKLFFIVLENGSVVLGKEVQ